jgi:hypothetical protein
MYEVTVPMFTKVLNMIDSQLTKAADHAKRARDPNVILQDRLVFDMLPLIKQIQICTDIAKRTAALISGVELPKFEDTEKTFEEAHARIQKTLDFLATIKPEQFEGKEETMMPMAWMPTKGIKAQENILTYIVPNFYFHAVTAYAILRKNGVEIGKSDFMGELPLVDVAE